MGAVSRLRNEDGWIILRTAGRSTLSLAASLAKDGFEVWTPARDMKIRKPRWNVHRDVRVPLMASFVFARARHLVDLIEQSETVMVGCPEFSVFHHFGRIPFVSDSDLEPLREEERAAPTQAELRNLYRKGEKVMVTQGIFGGMAGVVERSDGTHTLVRFGSRMRVKISTFILKPNCARNVGKVAKAA